MDHAEARELLELAGAEPGGLDRLAAGDTSEAAAIAAHLAGCADCTTELGAIRRDAVLIREVVRTTPLPDLRARTLAFVAAVGRERLAVSAAPVGPIPISSASPAPASSTRRMGLWAASLAAAVIASVVATGAFLGRDVDSRLASRDEAIAGLAHVTSWSLRMSGEADAERVSLESTGGTGASGTLLYSPSTRELVIVTSGLAEPAAGREFRCWMEIDGQRVKIGRMFFGGGLAYWAGEVPSVGDASEGATFGISETVAANPDDVSGEPVLAGIL
jgi:hypothetical protein